MPKEKRVKGQFGFKKTKLNMMNIMRAYNTLEI